MANETVGIVSVRESRPDGDFVVTFDWSADLVERMRRVPGRQWHARLRQWTAPGGPEGVARLLEAFGPERVRFVATEDPQAAPRTALLGQFDDVLKLTRYSPRTRKAYLAQVRRFLASVEDVGAIGRTEFRTYIVGVVNQGLSRSYHAQAVSALRLFAGEVLGIPAPAAMLPSPKREKKQPRYLSHEEVRLLLGAFRNPKHHAMVAVLIGSGVRVSELVRLRLEDLESDVGLLAVRAGKGRKDRRTLYGRNTAAIVNRYIAKYRPTNWLFPGPRPGRFINQRSVQKLLEDGARRAGITKHVTPHTLRHTFATHLIMAGVSTLIVQKLMGHLSADTTGQYVHIAPPEMRRIIDPLDMIMS